VCAAGVQVLAFFIYNFLTNFILEPTYQTCFNATLQRLKLDPRITVRLGNDIVGEQQQQPAAAAAAGPEGGRHLMLADYCTAGAGVIDVYTSKAP
jgi:hypothetical protein